MRLVRVAVPVPALDSLTYSLPDSLETPVVGARVISSELKTPDLEAKILARIRTLDFGAKDVAEMVTTWPLDFLPA